MYVIKMTYYDVCEESYPSANHMVSGHTVRQIEAESKSAS